LEVETAEEGEMMVTVKRKKEDEDDGGCTKSRRFDATEEEGSKG